MQKVDTKRFKSPTLSWYTWVSRFTVEKELYLFEERTAFPELADDINHSYNLKTHI